MTPFATSADFEVCRRLHRRYGTTYYFASRRFPAETRRRVDALYGFVRVPDEWVDNPETDRPAEIVARLRAFRAELLAGCEGTRPDHPVLRAFVDVMRECEMPPAEPLCFLDAMEQDLTVSHYETYDELLGYMRGSAAAVGLMMCHVLGARQTPEIVHAAMALGNAMQLTNFLRDVGEDLCRGRVYLPLDEMRRFGLYPEDLYQRRVTPEFVRLMEFQIERARALYGEADAGIPLLPPHGQKAVRLARVLYSRILDRIEARGYDVFGGRARTSRTEKVVTALRVMLLSSIR